MYRRTQCQWNMLLEEVFHWEDIGYNENNRDRVFKSLIKTSKSFLNRTICTPKIGKCKTYLIKIYLMLKLKKKKW